MGTFLTRFFVATVLCGVALAQHAAVSQTNTTETQSQQSPATQPSQANSQQADGVLRIAPGSVIPVQLTRTIDAKKVKTGDQVEAKVMQDLKTGNGEVVVPKDTKVIGHVTEAQVRNKAQKESEVGIAFDHALVKNGAEVPLPMSIQAIIAPPTANLSNNNVGDGTGQLMPDAGGMPYGGRSAGMVGAASTQPPNPSMDGEWPANAQAGSGAHPPVTGSTQGVVGISNLKLSTPTKAAEGSVVSSEKNNVKLETGTLMLLRVNK